MAPPIRGLAFGDAATDTASGVAGATLSTAWLGRAADVCAIVAPLRDYYEGVERADRDLLELALHPTWTMRDTDMPCGDLNIESRAQFILRVRGHGPYAGYSHDRALATFQLAENLALVRVDKGTTRTSTAFFLNRSGSGWTLLDKVWVPPRAPATGSPPGAAVSAIEWLVDRYFAALRRRDMDDLEKMLHPGWDSKALDASGQIEYRDRASFLDRIRRDAGARSEDYTQFVNIDASHRGLAIVRIDVPNSETRFLVAMRLPSGWSLACERVGG